VRDAAQAVRKALEALITGAEVVIIVNADTDTVMTRPNAELMAGGLPRRAAEGRRRPEREAALDREGEASAGLRAWVRLARRHEHVARLLPAPAHRVGTGLG
jgi:hypothetical protein